MAFGSLQQAIPWVGCAAGSAAVIGLMLFTLRGEPVDFGKYLGATPLPASVQRAAPAERPRAFSEGSGRTAPEAPASDTPEPSEPQPASAQPAPPAVPASPAEVALAPPADVVPAQGAAEPANAEPVSAEPPRPEPARPEAAKAEPATVPADAGALALLSPELPREAAPTPKAKSPRVRSVRKPAHLSAVQRRPRAAPRRFRGPPMQTITIFHGPYVEVVRVPRW